MSTEKEIIYLYAGEDHPKAKLTCEREFSNIKDLISYFHSIQDTFYIEFDTCETITENLKLRCISYGGDEFDETVPFFILEYDEKLNNLYVWKSEGGWEFNKLISHLYSNKSGESGQVVKKHPKFQNHEKKDMIAAIVEKLNIDWSSIDLTEFWNQLEETVDHSKEDEASFKSFISMAVLRTKVIKNKKYVSRSLMDYYQKMKSNTHHVAPVVSQDEPKYTTSINSKDQIVTNFMNHFKLMAEDYETFDLKNWAAYPKQKSKQSGSRQKNRISKVKS